MGFIGPEGTYTRKWRAGLNEKWEEKDLRSVEYADADTWRYWEEPNDYLLHDLEVAIQ